MIFIYGTGPVHVSQVGMGTFFTLRTLETFHDSFQHIVPYKVMGGLWDQSHVLLQDMYGASPIKYMGLQNKEIQKTSTKAFN